LLNNEMDDFSAKPGVANAYGLVGGDANAVQAGKRPLSSMTPTLVLKDGKPVLVTGSPGGARIITTVLQQVVNHIDFGMNRPRLRPRRAFITSGRLTSCALKKASAPIRWPCSRPIRGTEGIHGPHADHRDDGLLRGASDPRNPDGTMG
jgi:gamma-glutamyltranspeptidase/glutathione hydrolase